MKIFITGANGLLGQKLIKLFLEKEVPFVATSSGKSRVEHLTDNYCELDITNENQVKHVLESIQPTCIINTAAMTNVDACEDEREKAYSINVEGVKNLLNHSEQMNAHFIHLSTDFIFDGEKEGGMYTEEEAPSPLSYYAETKLESESIVKKYKGKWSIIRTVLVYGIVENMSRSNIILWIKKSLEDKKPINVVNDQYRTPTLAEDLAYGCYLCTKKTEEGIYNISGKDLLTPYQIANRIADFWNLDKNLITPVSSDVLSQKAKRPPFTGLNIGKAKNTFGYNPHSFEEGLEVLSHQLI